MVITIPHYESAERIDENHLICSHCKKIVPHNHHACVDLVQLEALQETKKFEKNQLRFNELLTLATIILAISTFITLIIQIEPYITGLKSEYLQKDLPVKEAIYAFVTLVVILLVFLFLALICMIILIRFKEMYSTEKYIFNFFAFLIIIVALLYLFTRLLKL